MEIKSPGTKQATRCRIGVFAPSSPVSEWTLQLGVDELRRRGLGVQVHPQTLAVDFIHAGSDEMRADTLWQLANDPDLDVIWAARGGYGATKLLPILETRTSEGGRPPRKLLAGFSDVTALHEFTRHRWGWSTLHAPMPGSLDFSRLGPQELDVTLSLVRGEQPAEPGARYDLALGRQLTWLHRSAELNDGEALSGRVFGGNLAVLNYLSGTPWQPQPSKTQETILFVEDLNEGIYRVDAFLNQLSQVGTLDGVKAIVLGTFTDCKDQPGVVLADPINAHEQLSRALAEGIEAFPTKPLRPSYPEKEALKKITEPLATRHGLSVAYGLPVGHGPDFAPLPLGARCTLTADGQMLLDGWDWLP